MTAFLTDKLRMHYAGLVLTIPEARIQAPDPEQASCRNTDNPEIFFPEDVISLRKSSEAAQECASCPVRDACFLYGVKTKSYGIWGGTTLHQRELIVSQVKRFNAKR